MMKEYQIVCIDDGEQSLSSLAGAVPRRVEGLAGFASLVAKLLKRHHLDAEEEQCAAQLAAKVRELREANERVRPMHAAAEQVAMLPKRLTSTHFSSEVVKLVTWEAPRGLPARADPLGQPEQR